jgi:hypothetical protein
MKIINLPRGSGKTERCLFYSEEHNVPILCTNVAHKNMIISRAKTFGMNIPTPICINDLQKLQPSGIIIDEAMGILQKLINRECNKKVDIKCVTFSDEENSKKFRTFNNIDGYRDEYFAVNR